MSLRHSPGVEPVPGHDSPGAVEARSWCSRTWDGTSCCTDSMGKSHFVVYMKSTLAVRTSPATLARIDVTEGASAISFG